MYKSFALAALFIFSPLAVADAHGPQYGMVNLTASASADVINDELVTRLQVIEDGSDPAKLTNLVNKKTALVLDAVKNFKDISAKTSSYSTRPLYHDGKVKSWQVTQQLTLETANFEQMSQFIADISTLANIQSMHFQVSQQKAESVKQTLTKQAIQNFKDKAMLVATEFERSGYELVNLSINGNHFRPMPVMERSTMMMADSLQKSAPAALSGGSNEVSVQVNGSVQLKSE
jgi:predicted secreted protein